MKCIVCDKEATYFLVHKETKTLYPICEKCTKDKLYNESIFDIQTNIDSDIIKGRRLTNLESMSMLIQEPMQISQEVLNDILKPYIKTRKQKNY